MTFLFSQRRSLKLSGNLAAELIQQNHSILESLVEIQNNANVTFKIIKAEINSLSELKEKVIEARCPPQEWPVIFLSHPVIEQFLIWSIKLIKKNNWTDLKPYLQQIINPVDLTLMKSDEKYIIIQEICGVETGFSNSDVIPLSSEHVFQYLSLVKCSFYSLLQFKNPDRLLTNKSNSAVLEYIEQLTDYYKTHMAKANQKLDSLFIDTLLRFLSYNPVKNKFEKLYEEDFLYLTKHLDNYAYKYYEISKEDTIAHESFIIKLGITLALGHPRKCEMVRRISNHIVFIKDKLGKEFSPQLNNVLEMCYTSKQYNLEKIIEKLNNNDEKDRPLSTNNSHDICTTAKQACDNLHNLLTVFNMIQKYPQKLTFRDALLIRHEVSSSQMKSTDLPLVILRKIMVCDENCRSIIIPCKILKNDYYIYGSDYTEGSHNHDTSDSEVEDQDGNSNDQFAIIHPTDIITLLLHCSDNFLRHELFAKLFSCQIAIPLLLPDAIKNSVTLLIWALRSVKKTWKVLNNNGTISTKNCSIVDHEGPIVSFLKLGQLPKSKSELLNKVVGGEDIFFHWDLLKEQNCYKIISQGVVELCCYYPGKKTTIFKDAVIFTNLHGDASNYPKQVAFIQSVSFISCVLIRKTDLSKKEYIDVLKILTNCPGGVILILTDARSYRVDKLKNSINCEAISVVGLKDKTSIAIQDEIQTLLFKKIEGCSHKFNSIANCIDIAHKCGIEIDEENANCVLGKKEALHMKEIIDKVKFTEIKGHFFPLQGHTMWQKWAAHEKEYYRHKERKNHSPSQYKILKEQEMDETRFDQLKYINSSNFSPLIIEFLKSLLRFKGNSKSYFIQWLKKFLDNLSKDSLLDLQTKYQKTKSELEKVPSTETVKMKELKELSKFQNNMLINASVGIEHFFREIGQIYETVVFKDIHQPSKTLINFQRDEIDFLPMIAAETLVEGFAIEIMDGEASHVPLTWVKAILQCLQQMYANKTLFILSILGVQSSGKSTLLNTMFGLRFNVSVARCTRGAFIQLLPLEEELKDRLHCDFILIIDTEGICAPELLGEGSEQHDNELATFVIGLADFTIINIYGETPANLSDILQTVLHAFIRMKEVEKHPGCLFVHQNVTEQLATDKLQPGKQVLLDQLNNLTQAVANIERCEAKYQKFQDVMKFDIYKDVYYFSSLWKGDPPMAPINLGYSQCAQDLKQAILSRLVQSHQKFCSFESFAKRIESLWTAVLKENFIFSFKNTMEVVAYSELDLQYGEWSWRLQEVLENQLLSCENRIKSKNKDDNIETIKNTCINDSIKMLNQKCDQLCNQMSNFIKNHDLAKILSKWHFDTKDRLTEKKKAFVTTLKQHCDRMVTKKENERKNEQLQQQYEEKLREEITELVAELGPQKTADLGEIRKMFNANWTKWIAKFSKTVTYLKYASDEEIDGYIETSLGNMLEAEYSILSKKLDDYSLHKDVDSSLIMIVERIPHIGIKSNFKLTDPTTWMKSGNNKICTIAQDETNKILQNIQTFLKSMISTKKEGVTQNLPDNLLKELFKAISIFNESSHDFFFTSEYKVDIALLVCRYAAKEFKLWTSRLKRQNDPILPLNQQKSRFLTVFTNKYLKVSTEIAAANEFCSSLIDSIVKTVANKLHVSLVSHLKATNGNFNSKTGFKVQILTDLAEQENFHSYKIYLTNSTVSFQEWAQRYILNLCASKDDSKKPPFLELAIEEINQLVYIVINAVGSTDISSSTEWLNNFCSAVDGTIEIKKHDWIEDVKNISNNIDSMEHFKTSLVKELKTKQSSKVILNKVYFECSTICEMAGSLLYDSVVNVKCTLQCPFCSEQCDIINKNHLDHDEPILHHARVHRPQCVNRVTWYGTKKLVLDVCNSLVDSKCGLVLLNKDPTGKTTIPYKSYQQEYPEWSIPGEKISDPPLYWMWFISRFYKDLVEWSGAVETDIPDQWKAISKSRAINSLKKTYDVYYSKDASAP